MKAVHKTHAFQVTPSELFSSQDLVKNVLSYEITKHEAAYQV
jgi:hypothetical protein